MNNYTINEEKLVLRYLYENPIEFSNYRNGFFSNETLDNIAKVSKKFYNKFKRTPTKDELKQYLFGYLSKKSDDIDIDELGDDIRLALDCDGEYENDFLESKYLEWIDDKALDKAMIDAIETYKINNGKDKDSIRGTIINLIKDSGNVSKKSEILNYWDIETHVVKKENKVLSGYDFIDNKIGGYDTKTLNVYLGPSNIGKSIFLANDAINFIKNGKNVLLITCEMSASKFTKRIDCNLLNIKMSEWDSIDREKLGNKLKKKMSQIPPMGNLFIIEKPTGKCGVKDVEKVLKDCEEENNLKIDAIVIDYINIMKDDRQGKDTSDNTYIKIKNIAEDLRALAIEQNVVVISATQTNRNTKNQEWSIENMTMDSVSESSGLTHTVDTMLGIIQDTTMHANNEYWLKILKIRDGEGKNECCKFMVEYDYMRLNETEETTYPYNS